MIIKLHEFDRLKIQEFNFYLFYGLNSGLIEETINKSFRNLYSKNIINYEEAELINNINEFKERIFNKSFFDDNKLIIINRASNKILPVIEELNEKSIEDTKIIIKTEILEKKSKLRNFFERNKDMIITAFYEDNQKSLSLIIQKYFREKKISISNEIISLIIRRSKGNRINALNEIEKIASFSKSRNNITLEDVFKLTNLAQNHNISELVDQYLSKNKKKTIEMLNENNINVEENIFIIRSFLNKLNKLKKLKNLLKQNQNIEKVLSSFKPPIFWKDKEITKQQLNNLSLNEIKTLIHKVNNLELLIKKNNQLSNHIINDFILERFNN
ncbi:DNA polymerase III subunit delta [Candidatus Pelagibacter sp.]|jgi:DNA polymerase-3 subunit delta|nr:DNA polymerase III subunit delta [Candidatus Pelagibacter sp.]